MGAGKKAQTDLWNEVFIAANTVYSNNIWLIHWRSIQMVKIKGFKQMWPEAQFKLVNLHLGSEWCLPHPSTRHHYLASIRDFFASLPAFRSCPLRALWKYFAAAFLSYCSPTTTNPHTDTHKHTINGVSCWFTNNSLGWNNRNHAC